ncbi:MAG: class I SAM-dependent methyltransferase [Planctomycetaceae bacterium]|nr:class I SAM-dependent methyltransferase [Planctomycetaceae bacterium]
MGLVLLALRAGRKIAVDPEFKIPWRDRFLAYFRHRSNRSISYFAETSDDFFANHASALSDGIDVAFVDGLHTHEQAHRDVVNCLKYLKPSGVIVMHDCLPPHAAAALAGPSLRAVEALEAPGWTGEWTGDVYKSVMQLRAERSDLNVFVLDCDYGIGIVEWGQPETTLEMNLADISALSFEEFSKHQQEYLNLKPAECFSSWLNSRSVAAAD